jgi:hypothetical protein
LSDVEVVVGHRELTVVAAAARPRVSDGLGLRASADGGRRPLRDDPDTSQYILLTLCFTSVCRSKLADDATARVE